MGIAKRASLIPAMTTVLLGVVFQLTLFAQTRSPVPAIEKSSAEPTRIEAPFL